MKVGIVGSGIGGLATAYFLNRQGHHVTIFESQERIGMDAHRLSIESDKGFVFGDVPSRMFNKQQWPELTELYDEIGVEYRAVDPSQSFSRLGQSSYLTLDVANRPRLAKNMLTDKRLRKIAADTRRFQEQGSHDLSGDQLRSCSFAEYLRINKYSFEFVQEFLFPTLSSTVFTCSYKALENYPAEIVLAALKRLFDSPKLMRTKLGTADVVKRLTTGIADIRTGVKVDSFAHVGHRVLVKHGAENEQFDHLVVATQANQAARMNETINEQETLLLESFQYENVEVSIHSDVALMPSDQKNWSTFNMILASAKEPGAAMCTVWMNRFHDEWNLNRPIFQTINPLVQPKPETVLATASLQRPVVSGRTYAAWEQLAESHASQGRRIWFAGSYAAEGLPLLETGVRSAKLVARQIGLISPVTSSD